MLAINLFISWRIPGISIGGHVGGLIGGLLAALALERFGRGHLAYGKLGVFAPAMLGAILVVDTGLIWYAVR